MKTRWPVQPICPSPLSSTFNSEKNQMLVFNHHLPCHKIWFTPYSTMASQCLFAFQLQSVISAQHLTDAFRSKLLCKWASPGLFWESASTELRNSTLFTAATVSKSASDTSFVFLILGFTILPAAHQAMLVSNLMFSYFWISIVHVDLWLMLSHHPWN